MGSLLLHVESSLQHVESLVVACWIFLIVTGRIFIVAWTLLNCGMWDLLCSMKDFFFFFAACGILVAACRSYKLSHVGSLLQHARSFYFWHEESFSCSMWDHFSCDTCDFYCGVWDMCCSIGDHLLQQTRFFYLQHLRSV